jgi:hypothetical protein
MNIKRETDHFDQPPYCSEVNPIERVCPYLKNLLAWGNFNSLDHPRSKLYPLGITDGDAGGDGGTPNAVPLVQLLLLLKKTSSCKGVRASQITGNARPSPSSPTPPA